jgi:hypothetical protein
MEFHGKLNGNPRKTMGFSLGCDGSPWAGGFPWEFQEIPWKITWNAMEFRIKPDPLHKPMTFLSFPSRSGPLRANKILI